MKSVKEKLCKKFLVAISMQSRDWNVLAILIISSITYLVTYARKKKTGEISECKEVRQRDRILRFKLKTYREFRRNLEKFVIFSRSRCLIYLKFLKLRKIQGKIIRSNSLLDRFYRVDRRFHVPLGFLINSSRD